jgi:hypothetical protein
VGNITIYLLTRLLLSLADKLNMIILEHNDPGVVGKITQVIEELEDVAKRLDRLEQ